MLLLSRQTPSNYPFLVLTNSGGRKLLSDFPLVGRDHLARGASNTADCLHPDQEALARVRS